MDRRPEPVILCGEVLALGLRSGHPPGLGVRLEHAARKLLELWVHAVLGHHEPAELVEIGICERGELGARRAALVGREPREHACDAALQLDLLRVLLR